MSAGFDFNNIQMTDRADVRKIKENFDKIETSGITEATATAVATTSTNGLMSSTDKSKLDGITAGAQPNNITTAKLNNVTQTISDGVLSMNETDPTVPSWAKQTNKPSYSWSEISNKPTLVTQSVVSTFWFGTQEQYEAITTKSSTTLYLIQEEAD